MCVCVCVWGACPKKPKIKKKNQTKLKLFLKGEIFKKILQGSLNPQNYELAPQLPENK